MLCSLPSFHGSLGWGRLSLSQHHVALLDHLKGILQKPSHKNGCKIILGPCHCFDKMIVTYKTVMLL